MPEGRGNMCNVPNRAEDASEWCAFREGHECPHSWEPGMKEAIRERLLVPPVREDAPEAVAA